MAHDDPYADTSAVGLSLWLVPAEPAGAELAATIAQLASTFVAASSAPRDLPAFPPHVTVAFWHCSVPRAEIEAHAAALAQQTARLSVTLEAPEPGPRFFQCVFARCAASAELCAPNALTQQRFGTRDAYMPHLSLAYGDLSDATKRAVALEASALAGRLVPLDRLQLWDTSGPVEAWALVRSFALAA